MPAAFALSQLRRVDDLNAQAQAGGICCEIFWRVRRIWYRRSARRSVPPIGYAYVWRVDPAYAAARGVPLRKMTEGIVAALKAEESLCRRRTGSWPIRCSGQECLRSRCALVVRAFGGKL